MDTALLVALAGLITAIAAIVAPVVTQFIAIRGSLRLKTVELFFRAKDEAYRNFLSIASQYIPNSDNDYFIKLESALSQALLYSSESTQQKLAQYLQLLREFSDMDKNAYTNAYADAYFNAVLAMRSELNKLGKYLNK